MSSVDMFEEEAEVEVSSESTSGDEEEDDTTLSISDPENDLEDLELDGAEARVASRQFLDVQEPCSRRRPRGAREASPVFYIDPDDWAGGAGEQEQEERGEDETLTAESAKGDQNTKEASAVGAICTRRV